MPPNELGAACGPPLAASGAAGSGGGDGAGAAGGAGSSPDAGTSSGAMAESSADIGDMGASAGPDEGIGGIFSHDCLSSNVYCKGGGNSGIVLKGLSEEC